MDNKMKICLVSVAKVWYLIAPIVVYFFSELDNIINKTCNWWLFAICLLFLVVAQIFAKYSMDNTDGGDISEQINKNNK